jgi:hypothetical protein
LDDAQKRSDENCLSRLLPAKLESSRPRVEESAHQGEETVPLRLQDLKYNTSDEIGLRGLLLVSLLRILRNFETFEVVVHWTCSNCEEWGTLEARPRNREFP